MPLAIRDGQMARTGDGRLRVLLLCSDDPQHAYLGRLLAAHLDLVGMIVEPGAAQRRRLWRRRRWRAALYREYHRHRQRCTGRAAYRSRYFDGLLPDDGAATPVHIVDDVNGDRTAELVRAAAPDLTVVCGTGVIRRALIERTPGVLVNVHGGWLPDYKGNHGVYFAFRNADWSRIGATVHVLTETLDSGAELLKVAPPSYPHDNDEHLYLRAVHLAMRGLVEVAAALEAGEAVALREQEDRGTTYRHRDRTPWNEGTLWLRRKLGRHRVPHREGVGR